MSHPFNENANSTPPNDAETRQMERWNRFLNGVFFYFSGAKWYVLCGIAGLLFFVCGRAGGLRWLSYTGMVLLSPVGLFLGLYVIWMLFSQILADITALSGIRYDKRKKQEVNNNEHHD